MGPKVSDVFSVFLNENFFPLAGTRDQIIIRDEFWRIQRRFMVTPDGSRRIPLHRIVPPSKARTGLIIQSGKLSDPDSKRCLALNQFDRSSTAFVIADLFGTMSGLTGASRVPFDGFTTPVDPKPPALQPTERFTATLTLDGKLEQAP
jgi:hypothetical protein